MLGRPPAGSPINSFSENQKIPHMVLASRMRPSSAIFSPLTKERSEWYPLVGLGLSFAGAQVASEIDGHGFVEEAGTNVEMQDLFPPSRGIAGFFT